MASTRYPSSADANLAGVWREYWQKNRWFAPFGKMPSLAAAFSESHAFAEVYRRLRQDQPLNRETKEKARELIAWLFGGS